MSHGCAGFLFSLPSTLLLRCVRIASVSIVVAVIATTLPSFATVALAAPSKDNVRAFLQSITGEWIGVCQQSTNGELAEDKYFHAMVKQVDASTFDTKFEYYRLENGAPLHIGTSCVTTIIGPDGTVSNKIKGQGTVLVENKPKQQQHDLLEVIKLTGDNKLEGSGSGSISVSGMPLGIGKNGKIKSSKSEWTLANNVLTIHQTIKATFKVLFFGKSFDVVAHYTATRGSDVASLMNRAIQSASKTSSLN